MGNIKYIHTTINKDLWKLGQFKEIKWSEALELGIKILSGHSSDRESILEKINKCQTEKEYWEKKLEEVDKKEEEVEESKRRRVVC